MLYATFINVRFVINRQQLYRLVRSDAFQLLLIFVPHISLTKTVSCFLRDVYNYK
jgi:hypothetical protein